MGDAPWQGDACSLVEEFRAGRRSPLEELEATYAAIDASALNAFCHLPREDARAAAAAADVRKPFGGVPIGVKELDQVLGWPDTHASVPLKDHVAGYTSTMVERIRDAGGDGGGSIRIPAGFTGLVGLKATIGRIPRGPQAQYGNLTVTIGCLSRSVRDTARWFDVCNGFDARDPLSLPRVTGWEAGLGTHLAELRGARVAFAPNWGNATVSPMMWELLEAAGMDLLADLGLTRVDGVDLALPRMGAAWSLSGNLGIEAQLVDHWPACRDDLTPEIRYGMEYSVGKYDSAARAKIERRRVELNEAMARIFDPADGVDYVITASNPDVAFAADGPLPGVFGGLDAGAGNNGRLTFPANLHGNPAISIPAGTLDGLPIGLQVVGRHFTEELLLDMALTAERNRPWPLVAPSAPC